MGTGIISHHPLIYYSLWQFVYLIVKPCQDKQTKNPDESGTFSEGEKELNKIGSISKAGFGHSQGYPINLLY